jgi:alpha,alpha-trehalase
VAEGRTDTDRMPTAEDGFTPLERTGGYLPIGDHGAVGDGRSVGLVARDGTLAWLCAPRFDSPPLFASLLDHARGGQLRTAPADVVAARQRYEPDTAVLVTELRTPTGVVRLTDAVALRSSDELRPGTTASARRFVRRVEALGGDAELEVAVEPRRGEAQPGPGGRLRLPLAGGGAHLWASRPLRAPRTTVTLAAGERLDLALAWDGRADSTDVGDALARTVDAWRAWTATVTYVGPRTADVRRSAITLKLLDHVPNGAIVAAATSSLPEELGGERNWDYRYTWVRDAAFSVYALRRIGLAAEAGAFLDWVLQAPCAGDRPRVLYTVDGALPPPEWSDDGLEGYRRSPPVRWGNAAVDQRQHDVFGEVVDCAFQAAAHGRELDGSTWARLRAFVDRAGQEWTEPDHGIWEVRTAGDVFTYSAAMCQVALDRGARMVEGLGLPGDAGAWRRAADDIVETLLSEAWSERRQALAMSLGGDALDASALALPLRRVLPADHPRMVATCRAVAEQLGSGGGLLHRYDTDEVDDGLDGGEGAFLLCSFWLVDNLALQGRLDEALELYGSLCDRGGALGLLPEQIDPSSGAFLGNYPQAFSHVGLIASGVTLARMMVLEGRDDLLEGADVPPEEVWDTAVLEAPPPRSGPHPAG